MTGESSLRRPPLPDVTLVAVSSVALRQTVTALQKSMRQADFGEVLLLSDQSPPLDTNPAICWRRVERIASRGDYSRFMLRELKDHITSGHALCVQWDGFVLDGRAWDPQFLDYDYIGAVWPHFRDGYNVGNGGFSLRSRRLLEACAHLPFDGSEPEDIFIARIHRAHLEKEWGIRFAPPSVAEKFAYERSKPTGHEFGFHGAFNLVRYLPRKESNLLFRELEPGVLTRAERLELLRWAVVRGELRLALTMLDRLV